MLPESEWKFVAMESVWSCILERNAEPRANRFCLSIGHGQCSRKRYSSDIQMVKVRSWCLLFLFSATAFAVRPGDFKVIGPGGGGAMFNPTISPHDPNTVLISCDMTGSYITHDGGQSWRMFNLRGVVSFFVFDPIDSKVMYAQATGLWRSTDNGESWKLVYPAPEKIKTIVMRSDHADEELLSDDDPMGLITALAVDPDDSKVLYATGDKTHLALFISRDWGKTWTRTESLAEVPRRIWIDPKSPLESRTIYLAGPHHVSVRDSSGFHNFAVPDSVAFTDVSAGFTEGSQQVMYGVSQKGVFVSKDAGRTWQQTFLPGS